MKPYYILRIGFSAAIADLSEWGNNCYFIHRINVPKNERGKGYGSKLLKMICDEADKENAILMLQIVSSGEMSDEDLTEWYRKYGFVELPSEYAFIRYPKILMSQDSKNSLSDSENHYTDLTPLCYNG